MQVWGKAKVEVRGLESMSRILPLYQEVLALSSPEGWGLESTEKGLQMKTGAPVLGQAWGMSSATSGPC